MLAHNSPPRDPFGDVYFFILSKQRERRAKNEIPESGKFGDLADSGTVAPGSQESDAGIVSWINPTPVTLQS